MKIKQRQFNENIVSELISESVNPLLARLYAARGVVAKSELETSLTQIIPPEQLTNAAQMAKLLADAIAANKKLLVIGDYDADGATATAVAVKGLKSMGANVDFLVPNRFEYGYGLTPEIVQLAATLNPDILLTVDNGIASVDGVTAANSLGLQVLITDHHLPGDVTPNAACIVNPFEVDDIRKGFLKVIEDDEYRAQLIANGFENAKRFDQQEIANQYFDLYRKIASA